LYTCTTGSTTSNAQALGVDDISIAAVGAGATPTVGFTAATSSVTEGGTASIGVTMTAPGPSSAVVVTITDAGNGTATSGSDYTAFPSTQLTFNPGTYPQTQNVSVITTDDPTSEVSETVNLSLAVTSGTAANGTLAHALTITDNDQPVVGFVAATSSVTEGGVASIGVSMNIAPAADVTVQVTRTAGTATSGTDFTTFPATNLTFLAAGSYPQTQNVSVTTTDDASFEAAETVILGLSVTAGSSGTGTTSHTLTINDNEVATLVINEIDYDNVGTDDAEWLELYNYGASTLDLTGFKVEFFNGQNSSVYKTITLASGTVAAGGYFVIGNNATTPNINLVVTPTSNLIENGSPDAMGLRTPANIMVDAISYEGSVIAPYVEGTGLALASADDNTTAAKVIARVPNGTDSNDNNADWKVWCATPGANNNGADSDADGVPDCLDTCPATASGDPVNTSGCSCAQQTIPDSDPCTLDACSNGVVTHTFQDADLDGVCDASDTCPGTASGDPVNTSGCSCAQQTIPDSDPCTLDACSNGVVTHTFQDADLDGVCDASDTCPGTASGAGVNASGCSCAQV
ncbi:MAG: Calx-beta domain-containing protein, partial [Flavobacteriales bacterium]